MRIKPPQGIPRILFYRSGTFPSLTAPSLLQEEVNDAQFPSPPLNGTFLPIRPRLSKGPFVGSGMAGNHCKAAAQPGFVLPAFPRDGSIVYPRGGGCRLSPPPPSMGRAAPHQAPTSLCPPKNIFTTLSIHAQAPHPAKTRTKPLLLTPRCQGHK